MIRLIRQTGGDSSFKGNLDLTAAVTQADFWSATDKCGGRK